MLGHRLRRWPNMKTTLGERFVFAGWKRRSGSCPRRERHRSIRVSTSQSGIAETPIWLERAIRPKLSGRGVRHGPRETRRAGSLWRRWAGVIRHRAGAGIRSCRAVAPSLLSLFLTGITRDSSRLVRSQVKPLPLFDREDYRKTAAEFWWQKSILFPLSSLRRQTAVTA